MSLSSKNRDKGKPIFCKTDDLTLNKQLQDGLKQRQTTRF
jgi:hypothetical protein